MLRFLKTSHGYVDRILPRPLTSLSHVPSSVDLTNSRFVEKSFHGSHPWPEWVELMQLLSKRGYFGEGFNPFDNGRFGSKDSNHIRTACLDFARHRFDLVRHLSRKDINVIAGCGCPSIDRKVVNSGKRLRAHVGIEEGKNSTTLVFSFRDSPKKWVCGSCNLRGECDRAYAGAREEGARTVDVMRILLTYGLDSIASTVENHMCKTKFVEDSVRQLLREIVEYSSKGIESVETTRNELRQCSRGDNDERDKLKKWGDWQCPQCKFMNFARNIRCLRCNVFSEERLLQWKEDQKDHLPLKKGDWICGTCSILNFARNTRCWRCREKPSQRELNPGEWECESCNYLNFRRNSTCLKCDHRRPKASKATSVSARRENEDTTSSDVRSGAPKTWRFVEGESEKLGTHVSGRREEEEEDGIMEFPVEGGSSDVSRSLEKREQWKREMSQRMMRGKEEETERSYYERRKLELLGDIADDEDMDGWFVPRG